MVHLNKDYKYKIEETRYVVCTKKRLFHIGVFFDGEVIPLQTEKYPD